MRAALPASAARSKRGVPHVYTARKKGTGCEAVLGVFSCRQRNLRIIVKTFRLLRSRGLCSSIDSLVNSLGGSFASSLSAVSVLQMLYKLTLYAARLEKS